MDVDNQCRINDIKDPTSGQQTNVTYDENHQV